MRRHEPSHGEEAFLREDVDAVSPLPGLHFFGSGATGTAGIAGEKRVRRGGGAAGTAGIA